MKHNVDAKDLNEWLIKLEKYEHLGPEWDHTVEVSVRLMCLILRRLIEAEWKYKELE